MMKTDTLNELCTSVSSRSMTMHFFWGSDGFSGGKRYFTSSC